MKKTIQDNIVRRASFDIGSGSTKLQISDVCLNTGKLINKLYGIEKPLAYGIDLVKSNDGNLTENIQLKGLNILLELKLEAEKMNCFKYSAIATEVFRKAKNGYDYLERVKEIGIPVRILTQHEEAEIGFNSVIIESNKDPKESSNDIVWDSGGASFQITSVNFENNQANFKTFLGSYGTSITLKMMANIRSTDIKELITINPVSNEECSLLINNIIEKLDIVPDWLLDKDIVYCCNGMNSMFNMCSLVLSYNDKQDIANSIKIDEFSFEDVSKALELCLNQTDDDLLKYINFHDSEGSNSLVTKLCLLTAVMKHTGIKKIKNIECIGSCAGVLYDDKFW